MGITQSIYSNLTAQPSSVNHDPSLVIRISDNAVRKIQNNLRDDGTIQSMARDSVQAESSAPALPGVPTPADEIRRQQLELERLEQSWRGRLAAYEKQNLLLKAAAESLASPPPELPTRLDHVETVDEMKLKECYVKNAAQPVKCSREVRKFLATTLNGMSLS